MKSNEMKQVSGLRENMRHQNDILRVSHFGPCLSQDLLTHLLLEKEKKPSKQKTKIKIPSRYDIEFLEKSNRK